jgi:hypothetical protein
MLRFNERPHDRFSDTYNGGNMFKARKHLSVSAVLALIVGAGTVASPAVANDAGGHWLEVGVEYTAPLYFGGFDAEIAAQNGYELREDAEGRQYITSIDTPVGDMTGANYLPREVDENGDLTVEVTESELEGIVTQRGVVTGTCGSSSIFFESSNQYQTSYTFNKPGGTFEHTWIVRGTSGSSTKSYDLSGLAPFGGVGWISGLKSLNQSGFVDYIKVTTGVAYGVLGYVCFSGNPSDLR